MSFKTPIVILAFNRPAHLRRVLELVKSVRPSQVLAVCDAARSHKEREGDKVSEVRELLLSSFDSKVLKTNFAGQNMGCRARVSSGLSWAFEQVEEAIILEDDCLPDPTFFEYCSTLLERYRNNPKVFQIAGNHFFPESGNQSRESYFFSRFAFIWGWATWRRAWRHYDVNMNEWKQKNVLQRACWGPWWRDTFDRLARGEIDTWDYQWQYVLQQHSKLSIVPAVNLISNIGFDSAATHTTEFRADLANAPLSSLEFPLKHPHQQSANIVYDKKVAAKVFASDAWQGVAEPARNFVKRSLKVLRHLSRFDEA